MKMRFLKSVAAVAFAIGGPLAHAGTVTYVYTDPQGTPLAEANAGGTITATFDYSPYGRRVLGNPTPGPGYTGHVEDPDTGFVYMQARYYDPVVGRFLSVDPIPPSAGNIYSSNRMLYGNSNPVTNIDPSGMSCEKRPGDEGNAKSPFIDSGRCEYAVMSFKSKLQRNARWLGKSIKGQLGVRLGLNAKIKVGKIGRIELGTGYIGEGGELNANFDYAQIYSGKGPSAAFQVGKLKLGAEAGGWETRTPLSIANGMSIQENRTPGFLFGAIEKNGEWMTSPNSLSIEANPLIIHGEFSVNLTGVAVSILYWGDSDIDPTE